MEFDSRRRVTPSINLSALIDVAFILVIFIVLIANFRHPNDLAVTLPEASSSSSSDSDLIISIPVAGPLRIQGKPVDAAELREVLQLLRPKFQAILLMADEAATVQRAVQVMDEAQGLGYSSVGIATQGMSRLH